MIPRVIHFICIRPLEFKLVHYLAIASAVDVHNPDIVKVYVDKEPDDNMLWEAIKKKDKVNIVFIKPLTEFRGINISASQYKADIIRLERLMEDGGIYLDLDVLSLKSFDELLDEHCVVGSEGGPDQEPFCNDINKMGSITNAVLLSEPNNEFIKTWYNQIADNIEGKEWAYHAVCLPKHILCNDMFNVRLEPKMSFMPFCFRDKFIFDETQNDRMSDLDHSYTMHLWATIWKNDINNINISYFMKNDNIFTKIFRRYVDELIS